MIREALQYLTDIGRKASEAQVIDLPDRKMGVVLEGKLTPYDRDRPGRKVRVATLASLVDWASVLGDGRDVQVLVGEVNVTCDVDLDEVVPDRCQMEMEISRPMAALMKWRGGPLSIKQVVGLLRAELDGTCDKNYLSVFRRVDFSRANSSSRAISHASESMGRSVEMTAQSSHGEIPETLVFQVPMYRLGVPMPAQTLRYAVDVDSANETVAISEIGDCLRVARENARADVAEFLTKQLPEGSLVLIGE